MKAQPSTIFLPNPIQDAIYKADRPGEHRQYWATCDPVQFSNMRNAAFSIVILKIKEWQDIWLTRLAVWKCVKNVVKNLPPSSGYS
jgi:hypothetical protein